MLSPRRVCAVWRALPTLMLMLVAALCFHGCGSGAAGLQWHLTPTTRTIAPGASTTFSIDIASRTVPNGEMTVAVTGVPTGVTGDFPSRIAAGTVQRTVTLTTTAATPVGAHTISITLTESNGTTLEQDFLLTIAAPSTGAGDFSLELNPQFYQFTSAEQSKTFSFFVRPLNGFSGAVAVTLEDVPDDIAVVQAPTPASVTIGTGGVGGSGGTFVLRFAPRGGVDSASFITVRVKSGAVEHTGIIELTFPTGTG